MTNLLKIAAAVAVIGSVANPASAQYTATVNAKTQYQTFEGFGTTLSWWANGVGSWSDPTRSALVDALFAPPPTGLGLTYARYNIGGGDCPCHNTILYPHAVPGYQLQLNGAFDWNADANQRWVAQRAYANGAVFLEAQSNSPPWWMTVSGSSTGSADATSSNMSDAYTGTGANSFPRYLATVVGHFASSYGLTFRHIEATNEPDTSWWKFGSTKQEGAAVTPAQQGVIVQSLASLLPSFSPLTTVASMDSYNIDNGVSIFAGYSAETKAAMTEINTHSYAGSKRSQLASAAAAAGKRLVMSEWGSAETTGKSLSQQLTKDIRELKPLAWAIWQPDWPTLMTIDYTSHSYTINKNYYIYANYTRYIKPGAVFIDINDGNSLAAYDGNANTLTIVTTNWTANTVPVTYALSNFTSLGASAQGYRTSSTQNVANIGSVAVSGGSMVASLPPNSVTTWVVTGANYTPPATSTNDSSFTYSTSNCGATWCSGNQTGAYSGQNHWSSLVGSTYSLTFTGTQARVYGSRASNQGIAAFSVDNGAETDVDLYAATRTDNTLTYATPTLPPGTHTIKVRVTGLKNSHATSVIVQADRIDVVN
ncbi:glycoside hydrolase [Undibacterium sp. Di26W]|uniref:glycoside hydrolase n=1 Tax=Undibacterium sp. Di26W TaxID=3413035 RepID=UPI003BF0F126